MKINLLIAADDADYVGHLSRVLSEKHSSAFHVNACTSLERLGDLLSARSYDAALLEPAFASAADLGAIRMPLLLLAENAALGEGAGGLKRIRKYQRISTMAGSILELYADVSKGKGMGVFEQSKAQITAVWSPAGGAGKTTAALAYAAYMASSGKLAVYLDLECFSSTPAYFSGDGKSISKAFEKLESNIQMFLMGIRQQDIGSAIMYFNGPDNYDDMNILTPDNVETIVNACAAEADALVVDLPSQCDDRVKRVLGLADAVLLVCDPSSTSQAKLAQFVGQHNVFGQIEHKTVLINNKGAKAANERFSRTIHLPLVNSVDPVSIYKTLSGSNFEW